MVSVARTNNGLAHLSFPFLSFSFIAIQISFIKNPIWREKKADQIPFQLPVMDS